MSSNFSLKMRTIHRYLGFFLAGIMAVYALSGIVLIFRDSNLLKQETPIEQQLAPNIQKAALGEALKIKRLKVTRVEGDVFYFKDGTYNQKTGVANYVERKLPYFLSKMTHLHKAKSKDPLFFLNIFFGLSLLFFVISSFWMFMPKTAVFRKGMYFTLAGIVLTLVLLFI